MASVIGRVGSSLRRTFSAGDDRRPKIPPPPHRRADPAGADEATARARARSGDHRVLARPDGHADPGEVVWTWVPYEDDPSQGKDRPVVIIGRAGPTWPACRSRRRTITVTTRSRSAPGAWDRSGRPSFAKVDQLITVDPTAVRREGSALARGHFDDVVAGVARFHDVRGR